MVAEEEKNKALQRKFIKEFSPYFDALYHYARKMIPDQADAEDLVQEALTRAYLKFEKHYQPDTYPKSWLFRIFINLSINHFHKQKHYKTAEITESIEISDPVEDQLSQMIKDENFEKLHLAIDRLKSTEQFVIKSHYFDYLKYREIAEMTRVPDSTVKTRIRRAKQNLKKALKSRYQTTK